MKTPPVLAKLVGKAKYLLTILYVCLVVLNQKYQLGLEDKQLDRIMWVVLAALGLDAAEGSLANFKRPESSSAAATDTPEPPASSGSPPG